MSIVSVGVLSALGLAAFATRAPSQGAKPETQPAGGGPVCTNMMKGAGTGSNMMGAMRRDRPATMMETCPMMNRMAGAGPATQPTE